MTESINFQAMVEGSVDMMHQVRVRPGGWSVEYASPSTAEVLGWSSEEAMRLRPEELFAEWSLPLAVANLERVLTGQPAGFATLQARHRDGSLVWVEFRVRLLQTHADGEATVLISGRDVTEFKRLETQLANLVLVDALTGVGNRRAFDAAMQREWNDALAKGQPLSLVMVDVDHFKAVNDTFGHQVGDECLRAIAGAMQRMMAMPNAFVARYGGEELALLMPGTSLQAAADIARQLCETISTLQVPALRMANGAAITVSCGVSSVPCACDAQTCTPDTLVTAADAALYEAKRLGRNRVETHALMTGTHG